MGLASNKAVMAPSNTTDADNERTPLLAHDRRRETRPEQRNDSITDEVSDQATLVPVDDVSSSNTTLASRSTSPSSLRPWQRSRTPHLPPKPDHHKDRSRLANDHKTPCKSQRVASDRPPLSACLQKAHKRDARRPGIPLDRKRTLASPPSPRPGRIVIKRAWMYHRRVYTTIDYQRSRARDVEAQRPASETVDESSGEASIEDDCCRYGMVVVVRVLLVLVAMGMSGFTAVVFVMWIWGCFGV